MSESTFEHSATEGKCNKKFKRQSVREKFRQNVRNKLVSKKKKKIVNLNCEIKITAAQKRHQVVREILKVGKQLKMPEETQYLAICYYEEKISSDFQSYSQKLVKKLQNSYILAAILLFMSSKLNDVDFPDLRQLDMLNGNRFMNEVIEGESLLLEQMQFLYIEDSPFVLFSKCFPESKSFIGKCCNLFERTMLQKWSIVYGWQMVARAVVFTLDSDILEAEDPRQTIQIRDLSGRIKKLLNFQIY